MVEKIVSMSSLLRGPLGYGLAGASWVSTRGSPWATAMCTNDSNHIHPRKKMCDIREKEKQQARTYRHAHTHTHSTLACACSNLALKDNKLKLMRPSATAAVFTETVWLKFLHTLMV